MRWLAPIGGLGLLVALVAWPQAGRAQAPVVVEFFTSQGCSSCPPADEFFSELVRVPGIIGLALHVDYWDYLGWKDAFGKPEHSERQRRYAKSHGERTIYTPQMIVQGADIMMGYEEAAIRNRIAAHEARPVRVDVVAQRVGGGVEVVLAPVDRPVGVTEIHLVEYLPEQTMTVEGGENAGYRHTFSNVVVGWTTLGRWDGASNRTLRHEGNVGNHVVVLVQAPQNGPILQAARLP